MKEALALAAGHGRAGAKALAETKAAADADARTALIAQLRTEKKASAAQAKWLASMPLDVVRGFASSAMAHQMLSATDPVEHPEGNTTVATHNGKTWADMKPTEKAELFRENHALYQAMKAAAKRSGK